MKITKKLVQKVLDTVDVGLCRGVGIPEPGRMCVEAAVCYALGETHGDEPSCVDLEVGNWKIWLNDATWPSKKARAHGLRRVAIAQLGSNLIIDRDEFFSLIREEMCKEWPDVDIVPTVDEYFLRAYLRNRKGGGTYHSKLVKIAEMTVQVLKKLKSPGCKFLYMAPLEK